MIAILPAARLPLWNDKDNRLRCIAVRVETDDVRTFVFAPETPACFHYLPGQFLTLELPIAGRTVLRTYTLSSSPSRPYSVSVTVKAQPGSIGTRWMFDCLRPGDLLSASGPRGDFTYAPHHRRRALFVSAGSGVTPSISAIRFLSDCAPDAQVDVITCTRSRGDRLFVDELAVLSRQMPDLRVAFLVEAEQGRLDQARLSALSPDFLTREIYCCGPAGFMRHVQDMLAAAGFDMAHYHQESFQPDADPVPPPASDAGPVNVAFTASGVTVSASRDQTVLEIARAAGIDIETSCAAGLCGTCLTLKTAGNVEMRHKGGISQDEIDEGYILACCARPLGDLWIEA